ncbi:nucleotide exchange factor GrpE [Frateuria aurantia]
MENHEQPADQNGQPGAAEHEVTVASLQAALDSAHIELDQLRESVLRERAELENQRRRLQRDVEQARRFANEKLLNELLPVYDGLERGLAVDTADVATVREGLSLTLKSLQKVAENHGLVAVDPKGETFDPEKHQAMSMVEVPGVPANTVSAVLQKGYLLNDRLLRPALVTIVKDAD